MRRGERGEIADPAVAVNHQGKRKAGEAVMTRDESRE